MSASDGVYVIRPGGADRRKIAPANAVALGWSPDGRKILFKREVSGKKDESWWELWVMDADGGRPTRLPFNRKHWSVVTADWDAPHS